MAGIFLDSFDHYGTLQISDKWRDSNGSIVTDVFRTGSQSIFFNGAQFAMLAIDNALGKTMICGTAVRQEIFGGQIIGFSRQQANPLDECYVGTNALGQLQFVIPFPPGGEVRYTAPLETALVANVWYRVELKVLIKGDATGSFEVRLNGVTVLQATNVVTGSQPEPVLSFAIMAPGGAGRTWHDDVYLCDSTGTRNNDFLGDIRVYETTPTADGHYEEWTPLSGSNHAAMVNEIPPDGDGSYVSSDTIGQRDTYVFPFPDTPLPAITVPFRQALFYASKDLGGPRRFAILLRQNSADFLSSTDFYPSLGSYIYFREIFETNPLTGVDWVAADLVACEMGQEITG